MQATKSNERDTVRGEVIFWATCTESLLVLGSETEIALQVMLWLESRKQLTNRDHAAIASVIADNAIYI